MDPNKARQIFLQLAEYKIDVAIQRFNIIIYHDQKTELGNDLLLTVGFHLAHQESLQKSERIKSTFQKKRENELRGGERRTSICPSWMRLSDCKTFFELIPERADVVRRIFRMRIDEGLGAHSIANRLNNERTLNFQGKRWSVKLIENYLKMSQTIGIFQRKTDDYTSGYRKKVPLGEPIYDYYPSVVTREEFEQVQSSFKQYEKGTKSQSFKNLFAGMLKCPTCGGTLSYAKSQRAQPKLRCRNYLDGRGCTNGEKGHFSYFQYEQLLVDNLVNIDFSKLISTRHGEHDEVVVKMKNVLRKIANHELKIAEFKKQLSKCDQSDAIAHLASLLNSTCQQLDILKQERDILENCSVSPNTERLSNNKLETLEERKEYNSNVSKLVKYIILDRLGCVICFKGSLGYVRLDFNSPNIDSLRGRGI